MSHTNLRFSIDELRKHTTATQRDPQDRRVTNAALNAYEELSGKPAFTDQDLEPIIHAAFHLHRGPMHIGIELLAALAEHNEVAQTIWKQKAQSPKAHERRIAVACMADERIPRNIALEIVRVALTDRSVAVREFAASSAYLRGLAELRSSLRARIREEQEERVIQGLQLAIDGKLPPRAVGNLTSSQTG